jgi:dihydroorotate dehydrogenase
MVWYDLVRSLLFKLPAEAAHQLAFTLIKAGERLGFWTRLGLWQKQPPPCTPISLWGLTFPHRLGLAAGLDKNGELLPFWAHLGFAFVEVGTVTPRPQPGNPKPRLFRIPKDYALLNRMGFNNAGAVRVAQNLEKRPPGLIVGINIGKNKETPLEEAHKDYKQAFEILYSYGDFFVVNVSSPNTPGLRSLQSPESLNAIWEALCAANVSHKPILLKLSPDLSLEQIQRHWNLGETSRCKRLCRRQHHHANPISPFGPRGS